MQRWAQCSAARCICAVLIAPQLTLAFIALHQTAHARALVFGKRRLFFLLVPTAIGGVLVRVRVRVRIAYEAAAADATATGEK